MLIERAAARLYARAKADYETNKARVETDIERGKVNGKNLQAYNSAKTRAARAIAAHNLLNGHNGLAERVPDDPAIPDENGV